MFMGGDVDRETWVTAFPTKASTRLIHCIKFLCFPHPSKGRPECCPG